jgi:hypothetical protein
VGFGTIKHEAVFRRRRLFSDLGIGVWKIQAGINLLQGLDCACWLPSVHLSKETHQGSECSETVERSVKSNRVKERTNASSSDESISSRFFTQEAFNVGFSDVTNVDVAARVAWQVFLLDAVLHQTPENGHARVEAVWLRNFVDDGTKDQTGQDGSHVERETRLLRNLPCFLFGQSLRSLVLGGGRGFYKDDFR